MKNARSVLFIGNSYTYYNDMPTALLRRTAKAHADNAPRDPAGM